MRCRVFTLLSAVTLLLAACRAGSPPAATGGKLKVVATFSVIGDFAHCVGGEQIDLTTLVGPGADTHAFMPSPADGAALAQASVALENGLGFETWLDDLYHASGSQAARVVVTEGVEPLSAKPAPGEFDPHVWHSVAHAITMVHSIRDALVKADPANAQTYRAKAGAYIAELQALDAWVLEQVKTLPSDHRKLVTTHDTFGYFAQRYGFEVIGAVLPTSTEGASPSAQAIAALVETVRAAGIPAVFADNVTSNALLEQVAQEAGVAVIAVLFTDGLGPDGSEGDTYVRMVRHNVNAIVTALGG